jgi:hypothetical protein
VPGGGGTVICPKAIDIVAKHLYANPEGVSPRMTPRSQNPEMKQEDGLTWYCEVARSMPDEEIVEATGVVGDVYLLHPLMMHSASNNELRKVRVITNPPVSVKEPFVFDRESQEQFSVVERKTLKALGKERLDGWKIQAERQGIVPARVRLQMEMKRKEEERLRALREAQEVGGAKEIKTAA